MYTQEKKLIENKNKSVANTLVNERNPGKQGFELIDNRSEASLQRRLQGLAIQRHSDQNTIMQRLVINTGFSPLSEEMNKINGWIIASDLNVALRKGGWFQNVVEIENVSSASVGQTENIYLIGHGSAGLLGSELPEDVAKGLNKILPDGYQGEIRSLNCSAGVGTELFFGGKSGVQQLAEALKVANIKVLGAVGKALNHPVYENETRAFVDGTREVDDEINKTINKVNDVWKIYLELFPDDNHRIKAEVASILSRTFYLELEAKVNEHLISKGKTFQEAYSKSI